MNSPVLGWIALLLMMPGAGQAASRKLVTERVPGAVLVRNEAGATLVRYQLGPPAQDRSPVASGCFFHPLMTPKGIVVTEMAPPDHLYHRGIFLAWAEMHGRKDGDFWGMGERAPAKGRTILSKAISKPWAKTDAAGFRALNEWKAEDDPLLQEELRVEFRRMGAVHVLDLVYRLKADEDLGISRLAFGGFCVRGKTNGIVELESPAGPVRLSNPTQADPSSDWPDAAWYDLTTRFADGVVAGVAVINHPQNPPTLWHNQRELALLNPVVSAAAPLVLRARVPLVLRYRVVAHDGPAPRELLVRLAGEWTKE